MSENPVSEQATSDIYNFSCLTCRQRKVRCDKHHPCSQCVRLEKPCSFVPPVRGKRRRKPPKEGLHAKLRRYEELLRSYGAKIEPTNDTEISDDISEQDINMNDDTSPHINDSNETFPHSRLITKDGTSRYFDNGIWSNLEDEFNHPEEHDLVTTIIESDRQATISSHNTTDEHSLILSIDSIHQDLSNLHPTLPTLTKMWDIYIDRVDPLVKILHLPTFWPMVVNSLQNPQEIPKSLEALIFAFYYTTTSAFSDDECQTIMGERQTTISTRYKYAARQALINAEFLGTTNLMTLQAFVMFFVGAKGHYQLDTLFMLSGIAVRLALRMGLHRNGISLGLSPFESEMRTRLWWQIVHIDLRASEISGTIASKDLFFGDVKFPLNIEDEDLHPDMTKLPSERIGITPMVLCLLRCDNSELRDGLISNDRNCLRYDKLINTDMSIVEKDNLISKLEDLLERKYLRYCDPSNSLHCFVSVIARSSICKMKLLAHNPRQFSSRGIKVPQKDRDIIFSSGTKFLEYGNLLQSNPCLRKYMWQIRSGFIWDSLVYVLIETRHRKIGPEVDGVWKLINGVFSNYPNIFAEASDALETAIGTWTLQVWDDCSAARKAQGLLEQPTPEYITSLRQGRRPTMAMESSFKSNGRKEAGNITGNSINHAKDQPFGQVEHPVTDFGPDEAYDYSNLLSFDLDPNEWLQWERLFSSQGNF